MSAGRWKVEQEFNWLSGTYWIAWRPSGGWKGLAPKFPTHAEALAYADQQARTAELSLPRLEVSSIPTSYGTTIDRAGRIPLSTPNPDQWGQRLEAEHGKNGPTIRLNGPYGSIYWCSWDDVRTTALHLLALHYHHERNQP